MLVRTTLDKLEPLSAEEIAMLKTAAAKPSVFDEDCPELSEAELAEFRRVGEENRRARNKQTVTIRLSPQALKKARALGKGYTSVLGRMLEKALNDAEMIKECL